MLNMAGNFCTVKPFKLSQRSLDTAKEMDRIADLATVLEKIAHAIPLFQIFVGRSTYSMAGNLATKNNINGYDWQLLADSFGSINKIKKATLLKIAVTQQNTSMGEEAKFWGCIANALY
ncbi:hypothetical protein [Shewanella surugensis]|uniref:Uncharacterized protein n=1 Tax=Shewanella surugensis TaxID=212020 RepID=A0ABT0LK08_9GAMM|nr:hypothetical protein [Shewanella surugensis]MCL1127785.1 hypothetical protein [Shewanella surugensis]